MQFRLFLFVFTTSLSVWVPKQHRWISQGQQDDLVGPRPNVRQYLGRFPRDDQMPEDQVPPVRVQDQLPGLQRVGQPSSCISALLDGINYLVTRRVPMGQPPPPMRYDPLGQPLPPLLYDRIGQPLPTMPYDRQPDQQLIEEPRAEAATDQRSELSRLLGSSSSSNLLKRPSSNLLESDNEEDEDMTVESRQSKGPTLWRYKPAKRAGGWGSLFFTLLGGKEGQVRMPNMADYYASRIGKKENTLVTGEYYDSRISKKEKDMTMVRLPWQMGIFSPRLSKRTAAPKEEVIEDLEVKSSPVKYLEGKSSSPLEAGGDAEGGLQNLRARALEAKI